MPDPERLDAGASNEQAADSEPANRESADRHSPDCGRAERDCPDGCRRKRTMFGPFGQTSHVSTSMSCLEEREQLSIDLAERRHLTPRSRQAISCMPLHILVIVMSETIWPSPPAVQSRADHVFPTLTPAQIARVTAHGHARPIRPGEVLIEAGDRVVPFFVVTAGQVDIVRPSGTGETLVAVHAAGQFSGEVNMISGAARSSGPAPARPAR